MLFRSVIRGLPLTKHGLSLGTYQHTNKRGETEQREVFADTTFRGLAGKSPAWEGHIDYNVCDPRAATYQHRASTQPLHAARQSYRTKKRLYARPGLLKPYQQVFIFCFELFGGVHEETWEQLREWAREYAPVGPGRGREISALLQAWRMHLSLTLLDVRVEAMSSSAAKLRGQALTAVQEAEGTTQLQQRSRAYELCSRRSVLFDYAQRASDTRVFWRTLAGVG